jgi:cold shock CspA family protein
MSHSPSTVSSSAVLSSDVFSSSERYTGRVKWFNNKSGYGFITVTDGNTSGRAVCVHHSSIKVDSEQYKYLVQGEYVDFSLSDTKTSDHEYQAAEVCGIKGGKLMCETRRESRVAHSQYRSDKDDTFEPTKMPRSVVVVPRVLREPSDTRERVREPRPSERHLRERVHDNGRNDGREWTYVASNRTTSAVDTTHYQSGRGTGRGADRGRGRGERGLDRRRENERMREAR